MKLWTNTKFTGHCPVGTAAVVVAPTARQATDYLNLFLAEEGLEDAAPEDMEEVPFTDGEVRILRNGSY